jgi:hypothetical protein
MLLIVFWNMFLFCSAFSTLFAIHEASGGNVWYLKHDGSGVKIDFHSIELSGFERWKDYSIWKFC